MFQNRVARALRHAPLPVALLLLLLLTQRLAAQTLAAERPDRFSTPTVLTIAPLPPADAVARHVAPLAAPDGRYQSLVVALGVNNNWELFFGTTDGSDLRQLTNTPAHDVFPSLNRGATQIAFSSRRSGQYNIWTMDTSGGQLRRLTDVPPGQYAYMPRYAPDGRQIVFYRGGDGLPTHVWIMDADGGNQRRLTQQGTWNGHASFTPDGRIVFAAYRERQYRIWIIDADGSNEQQLTTVPYSATPSVSPDGQTLAFSGDRDGNGWTTIYTQPLFDAGAVQALIDEAPYTVRELTGYTPDGNFLTLSQYGYSLFNGDLYLTSIRAGWADIAMRNYDLLAASLAVDPAIASPDVTPPGVAWVERPPFAPAGSVLALYWRAFDGQSGLRGSDVVASRNAGTTWEPLLTQTPVTTLTLGARPAGERLLLALGATDRVYNRRAWQTGPRYSVTFYDRHVTGQVQDVRGAPLVGSRPAGNPTELAGLAAADGGYDLYLAQAGALTLARSGYGPMPPLSVPPGRSVRDLVLPPGDNAVQNGQFEPATLDGWQVVGGAVSRSGSAHSGSGALRIGGVAELTPLASDALPTRPLALGPDGRGYALDVRPAGASGYQLWLLSWLGSAPLAEEPIGILNTGAPANTIADSAIITPRPNGDLFVSVEGENRFSVFLRAAGSWGPPVSFNVAAHTPSGRVDRVALDPAGGLLVAWPQQVNLGYNLTFRYVRPDGTLAAPAQATTVIHPQLLRPNSVHPRPDGTFLLHMDDTFYHYDPRTNRFSARTLPDLGYATGVFGDRKVLTNAAGDAAFLQRTPDGFAIHPLAADGTLGKPVYNETGGLSFMDARGIVHLLASQWIGDREALVTWQVRPGEWIAPPQTLFTHIEQLADDPAPLVTNARGDVVLLVTSLAPTRRVEARLWDGDAWSPPLLLRDDGHMHYDLLLGDNGHLQATRTTGLWQRTLLTPVAADTLRGVRQTLRVPAVGAPTLALRYRFDHAPVGESGVVALIDAGDGAQAVLHGRDWGGWQHAWADLSAWAGQTVTLTVGLQQLAGLPPAGVLIDEVTVGAAWPNVQVGLSAPPALAVGETAAATLRYANTGSVASGPARVTLTLPAGVTLLAADPPANAGALAWDVGALAARGDGGAIALTLGAAADAVAGSTLPLRAAIAAGAEVEQADNSVSVPLFIGTRLHLPIVLRE